MYRKTSSTTKPVILSEAEFNILRDLIHERIGLFYHDTKQQILEDKLSHLLIERGFNSFLDYYYLLKYDSAPEQAWQQLTDALRVPETFFWREIEQMHVLTDVLIPRYATEYRTRPFKIWSAACSSGEEPVTIAMALNEAGWFEQMPIEIVASDLSATTIERAKKGLFRDHAFRKLPEALRAKYFRPQPGGWQVDPLLLSRIQWQVANLTVKAEMTPLARADVIFCRNVFIYFSDHVIRKVIDNFFNAMPVPSYLFVGVSESLLKFTTDFQLQEIDKVFVYCKTLS